ncbi:hypothetical protein CYMTET_50109 [Cymbomonas tetramitiformis]|uniref:DNA repair protein REV1 n=1 Tax=Cymbomonas tetramitiformis TaxID=36881 RepID=A0AAE0BNU8_9CHLO|nr:hypothetical protein CYMTET_50109 [Cymbomonas tetramitiformis]
MAQPRSLLQRHYGAKTGDMLYSFSRGMDLRKWEERPARKSVGAQVTWGVRFEEQAEAVKFMNDLAHEVAGRMESLKVKGRTVSIKILRAIRNAPELARKGSIGHGLCDHYTRSSTLPSFTGSGAVISREAVRILHDLKVDPKEIRGAGIQITRLDTDPASSTAGSKLQSRIAAAPAPSVFDPSCPPGWVKPYILPPAKQRRTGRSPPPRSPGETPNEVKGDEHLAGWSPPPRAIDAFPGASAAAKRLDNRSPPSSVPVMTGEAAATSGQPNRRSSPSAGPELPGEAAGRLKRPASAPPPQEPGGRSVEGPSLGQLGAAHELRSKEALHGRVNPRDGSLGTGLAQSGRSCAINNDASAVEVSSYEWLTEKHAAEVPQEAHVDALAACQEMAAAFRAVEAQYALMASGRSADVATQDPLDEADPMQRAGGQLLGHLQGFVSSGHFFAASHLFDFTVQLPQNWDSKHLPLDLGDTLPGIWRAMCEQVETEIHMSSQAHGTEAIAETREAA